MEKFIIWHGTNVFAKLRKTEFFNLTKRQDDILSWIRLCTGTVHPKFESNKEIKGWNEKHQSGILMHISSFLDGIGFIRTISIWDFVDFLVSDQETAFGKSL